MSSLRTTEQQPTGTGICARTVVKRHRMLSPVMNKNGDIEMETGMIKRLLTNLGLAFAVVGCSSLCGFSEGAGLFGALVACSTYAGSRKSQ